MNSSYTTRVALLCVVFGTTAVDVICVCITSFLAGPAVVPGTRRHTAANTTQGKLSRIELVKDSKLQC